MVTQNFLIESTGDMYFRNVEISYVSEMKHQKIIKWTQPLASFSVLFGLAPASQQAEVFFLLFLFFPMFLNFVKGLT